MEQQSDNMLDLVSPSFLMYPIARYYKGYRHTLKACDTTR